jgi:hypothetical protein
MNKCSVVPGGLNAGVFGSPPWFVLLHSDRLPGRFFRPGKRCTASGSWVWGFLQGVEAKFDLTLPARASKYWSLHVLRGAQ